MGLTHYDHTGKPKTVGSLAEIVTYGISGSPHTWTKSNYPDMKSIRVRLVGAGGGSGGTAGTSGTQNAASGGAGGGGYSEKVILRSALAASETVTVGAKGTGGATGNNDGTSGGTTSFGSHCSATGGSLSTGAVATASDSYETGGAGGTGSGGDINIDGDGGGAGVCLGGKRTRSNDGGSSMLSGASRAANIGSFAGADYGGGASGCNNNASIASGRAGSDGADGIVIVEIYN